MSWLRIKRAAALLLSLASPAFAGELPPSAAMLLYHHVATDTPASTSIAPAQFAQHMAYLAEHHTVLPLPEVVTALREGTALPDNAVVITFDDGYENIYHNAYPILKQYGFPYTIFINPGVIDRTPSQLSWAQVNEMQEHGATFANHTLDHIHMLEKKPGENDAAWLTRVWNDVTEAEAILKDKTGTSLRYLAYPFGEYNAALARKVSDAGYTGFGQHSGAAGTSSDFAALPRFPAAGRYARLDTLKTKLNSLSMPVSASSVSDPERTTRTLDSAITLTIAGDDVALDRVACFYEGDTLPVKVKAKTLHITFDQTLPTGRSRINCTAPSHQAGGRFYWYSQPFFIADKLGRYPN
ncbi:polysaccharide deacetylase family protein [Alteromonas sp. CYL-A6]|uniref:polysaccharide deacetylase family protein n=1 Tax=Alteromonas nitratireducens TaxID=3390813 RepID=UPI0034BCBFE1